LETIASEAATLGFEVNWQKTKVQALGCRQDMPLTIKVQGQDVTVVEEFVYLGSLIHSSTGSTCDISRQSAITRAAMQSLENQIWRSRLAISAELLVYIYQQYINNNTVDINNFQHHTVADDDKTVHLCNQQPLAILTCLLPSVAC